MRDASQAFSEPISPLSGVLAECHFSIEAGWIRDNSVPLEPLLRCAGETAVLAPDRQTCFVFRRIGENIRFCAYTKHVETLIGAGARAFIGMSVRELYGARPGLSEVLMLCLEKRERLHWEGWYTFHSDGSTRYLDAWCNYASQDFVFVTGEDRTGQRAQTLSDSSTETRPAGGTGDHAAPHASSPFLETGTPGIFIFTARSNNGCSLDFLNNRAAFILDYCHNNAPSFPDCVAAILPHDDQQAFRETVSRATFNSTSFRWESPMSGLRGVFLVIEAWPEAPAYPGMRYFGTISLRRVAEQAVPARGDRATTGAPELISEKMYGLSDREQDVAACLIRGMSNAEIAQALFIQECTVKKHITAIFAKTGVGGRVEFILRFADSKLGQ